VGIAYMENKIGLGSHMERKGKGVGIFTNIERGVVNQY
jgi:hypothetical protein